MALRYTLQDIPNFHADTLADIAANLSLLEGLYVYVEATKLVYRILAGVSYPIDGMGGGGGGGGGAASVPTLITTNSVYAVPSNSQVLFTEPIDMEAGAEISFDANSVLVEVN